MNWNPDALAARFGNELIRILNKSKAPGGFVLVILDADAKVSVATSLNAESLVAVTKSLVGYAEERLS